MMFGGGSPYGGGLTNSKTFPFMDFEYGFSSYSDNNPWFRF